MWLIERTAEQKIREAVDNGELDNLPGQGEPLELDDDSGVPEALRVSYRILKNSGFLPPEVGLRREIADVEALIARATTAVERDSLGKRLNYLLMRLACRHPDSPLVTEADYLRKLRERASADNG